MTLKFTKMHGTGNDFVVLDGFAAPLDLDPARIRRLADRHFGIGCDQVLVLEPPGRSGVHARYRIFNADGAEVEQCGNGARCAAQYLFRHGHASTGPVILQSPSGMLTVDVQPGGHYCVDMGVPCIEPGNHEATVAGVPVPFSFVSMGNPHAVIPVSDVATAPVASVGSALQSAPEFPAGVNVGFMQVCAPDRIRLRVFERGAGETLACGSGACAAVAAGRLRHGLHERVQVELPGGALLIQWPGAGHSIRLSGPATTVYEGSTEI